MVRLKDGTIARARARARTQQRDAMLRDEIDAIAPICATRISRVIGIARKPYGRLLGAYLAVISVGWMPRERRPTRPIRTGRARGRGRGEDR